MPMGAAYLREPMVEMMKDDQQRYWITAIVSMMSDTIDLKI